MNKSERILEYSKKIDDIHSSEVRIFNFAKRKEDTLCPAIAYDIYKAFGVISKGKNKLRKDIARLNGIKPCRNKSYTIKTNKAINFLRSNKIKCIEKGKYRKNGPKYSVNKNYYNDLMHILKIEKNLSENESYIILKEILSIMKT